MTNLRVIYKDKDQFGSLLAFSNANAILFSFFIFLISKYTRMYISFIFN